jgi:hypothetical protein
MPILEGLRQRQAEKRARSLKEKKAKEEYRYEKERGRFAISEAEAEKRLAIEGRREAREAEVAGLRERTKELKERRKITKEAVKTMRHPRYETAKAQLRVKGRKALGEAYEAGQRGVRRLGILAVGGAKETARAYGEVTGRAYVTGQRIAKRTQRRPPRIRTTAIPKQPSTMQPIIAPTAMSISERIAFESQQPSMFQQDILGAKQPVDFFGTGINSNLMTGNIIGETKKKKQRYY